ncbi:MAG: acetylornithine deacetylase [Pseudomonadales bacterium]
MSSGYTPRAMLDRLVAFPTVSRDSNLELIDFVEDYLTAHGVTAVRTASPCGRKANLHASIGPQREGGVVLSGHTDVVPVDGQTWSSDPFLVTARDERLYGRGTADMKSFLAIALALVPEMAALKRPIHLALSYDEEIGCLGAPTLIQSLLSTVPRPAAVIVGEPTGMRVVTAHKSIFLFATHVRGFEVHSSLQDDGVSAIMFAGRMLAWLGERQRQNRLRAQPSSAFAPGYTTVHCGRIDGGTASNITARDCYFLTDIRALPTERAEDHFRAFERFCREQLEPEMQAVEPSCHIRFDVLADVPGFAAGVTEPAVLLAQQLTGQNGTESVSYAAEAGQFSAAGLSVVVCGPGEIAQAHQPDEYITAEQFAAGIEFQRRLIEQLSR